MGINSTIPPSATRTICVVCTVMCTGLEMWVTVFTDRVILRFILIVQCPFLAISPTTMHSVIPAVGMGGMGGLEGMMSAAQQMGMGPGAGGRGRGGGGKKKK